MRAQRFAALLAAFSLAATAACGSESGEPVPATAPAPAAPETDQAQDMATTDRAEDRATPIMTESDQLRLEMADGACRNKDFKGFFQAFTGSWAVREKYTASSIRFGEIAKSQRISRQAYADQSHYPLATMDYFYVTPESAVQFERTDGDPRSLRYVEVEINQSGDNHARVDWLPGIFERDLTPPPAHLEEGLGELVQETGSGGHLLFYPTEDCWALVEDIRNPPLEL